MIGVSRSLYAKIQSPGAYTYAFHPAVSASPFGPDLLGEKMSHKTLAEKLRHSCGTPLVFAGFDGCVDEIVHVVDIRYDAFHYDRIRTLSDYGEKISAAAGLSLNVEIESIAKKAGGNGPLFVLGLKKIGADIIYVGCTGETAVDPVFSELAAGSEIIGILDPGQTDAMEFEDGKIIRSKLTPHNRLTWEAIMDKISVEDFAAFMDRADLISFNNWTMLLHMSDIWKHILDDVVPVMKCRPEEKTLFFDLADPEKRSVEHITEALEFIRRFQNTGFDTVLGLNLKEACEILGLIRNASWADFKSMPTEEIAAPIAEYMGISCLVVHPVTHAVCVEDGLCTVVEGPYCPNPVLTTGAGDAFNAGFAYGYINRYGPEDSLLLGVSSSGFYVRNGKNPTKEEVLGFIEGAV